MSVKLYHIYNRGNNGQNIFFEEKNYDFFLDKIQRHLKPVCDILSYCLMPNHFHLLVSDKEIAQSDGLGPFGGADKESNPSEGSKPSDGSAISKAIGIILGSYTQAINKKYQRTGSLFQQKTKFKLLAKKDQAEIVFHYIHQNPMKAGLVDKLENWKYSSFSKYIARPSGGSKPSGGLVGSELLNTEAAYELLNIDTDSHKFYQDAYAVISFEDSIESFEDIKSSMQFKPEHDPSNGPKPPDGISNKKIGLVLSGGGVRGVAHLGIIKALEEHDIPFNCISGTSAGSIVGALYASGYSVDEIVSIIGEIKAFKLLQPALSWTGILNMEVVEKFLKQYIKKDAFEALLLPLYITATNLRTGKSEYFYEGRLLPAVCASSCIPVLFNPVSYNGELYIDGGILNNLPVDPIKEQCDFIIGCHCNPVDNNFTPKNARNVMERALMMAITQNAYQRKEACDVFIEPKGLEPYKVLDLNKASEIFEIGYNHAIKQIEEEKIADRIQ